MNLFIQPFDCRDLFIGKRTDGFHLRHSCFVIKSYHVVINDCLGIPFESRFAVPRDSFCPWTIFNKERTEFRFVPYSIFRLLPVPTMPSVKLPKRIPISAMQIFKLVINFEGAWMKTITATVRVTY